jgi:hypothetical protein
MKKRDRQRFLKVVNEYLQQAGNLHTETFRQGMRDAVLKDECEPPFKVGTVKNEAYMWGWNVGRDVVEYRTSMTRTRRRKIKR